MKYNPKINRPLPACRDFPDHPLQPEETGCRVLELMYILSDMLLGESQEWMLSPYSRLQGLTVNRQGS